MVPSRGLILSNLKKYGVGSASRAVTFSHTDSSTTRGQEGVSSLIKKSSVCKESNDSIKHSARKSIIATSCAAQKISSHKLSSGFKFPEILSTFSTYSFTRPFFTSSSANAGNLTQIRGIHRDISNEGGYKIYQENENNALYKILLRIPELKETLAPVFKNVNKEDIISESEFEDLMKIDYINVEKSEILENFMKITYFMFDKEDSLAHTSFDNICKALVSSMKEMSDDELCKLLYLLQIWSPKCFRKDKNYFDIFAAIDYVQIQRLQQGNNYYDLHQVLLLLDFWAHLNLIRSSNFCKLGLKKLLNKSHHLEPKFFVQLMYFHCKYRSFHPLVKTYDIEFSFDKKFDRLTPNEIAIVLLAFFKSEKRFVSHNLCFKVAKTFINHLEELDSVSVNAFLKSMKHYFPMEHWNVLYQVCQKLYQVFDSVAYQVYPHAALVGTKIDVYHPDLIEKIAEKTIADLNNLRIKDLEKVLCPIVLFNHQVKQPDFLDIITQEFSSEKRQPELNKYPKTLISLVYHLILKNHYNFHLIEKCLNIEFLEASFGRRLSGYNLPKDLLAIDLSMDIEAPDYSGPRLPESLRHTLCKHYAWRKPGEVFHNKPIKADELSITAQNKLVQLLGGDQYVHCAYILPHFIKPDAFICLKDGKPVPIPASMSDFVHMSVYPPPNIGKWYAFIFLSFSAVVRNRPGQYKGTYICKMRQLKALGYEPIIITADEWINESEQAREQILRNKLGADLVVNGNNAAMSVEHGR